MSAEHIPDFEGLTSKENELTVKISRFRNQYERLSSELKGIEAELEASQTDRDKLITNFLSSIADAHPAYSAVFELSLTQEILDRSHDPDKYTIDMETLRETDSVARTYVAVDECLKESEEDLPILSLATKTLGLSSRNSSDTVTTIEAEGLIVPAGGNLDFLHTKEFVPIMGVRSVTRAIQIYGKNYFSVRSHVPGWGQDDEWFAELGKPLTRSDPVYPHPIDLMKQATLKYSNEFSSAVFADGRNMPMDRRHNRPSPKMLYIGREAIANALEITSALPSVDKRAIEQLEQLEL